MFLSFSFLFLFLFLLEGSAAATCRSRGDAWFRPTGNCLFFFFFFFPFFDGVECKVPGRSSK